MTSSSQCHRVSAFTNTHAGLIVHSQNSAAPLRITREQFPPTKSRGNCSRVLKIIKSYKLDIYRIISSPTPWPASCPYSCFVLSVLFCSCIFVRSVWQVLRRVKHPNIVSVSLPCIIQGVGYEIKCSGSRHQARGSKTACFAPTDKVLCP